MEKILVSGCFLGEKVRYDAKLVPLTNTIFKDWQSEGRLVSICPEVAGGLPIPRESAEIIATKVITTNGVDVTDAFTTGAQRALAICLKKNIHFALLKESSPSCGSSNIYDGSFTHNKIIGQGITTALLRRHGIEVFSEDNILLLEQRLNAI